MELVENSSSRKSKSENFISRFAKVYTPIVCYGALALAIFPPVVRMLFISAAPQWGIWIYRALGFDKSRYWYRYGAMGSDAAIEEADIVLMDDEPMQIAKAIKISRKCIGIVYQNILFALVIKFACLALGAFGIANMWFAIFADVGVMILAILNAIRALRVKNL